MDAPAAYGPYKTLYNRFRRWSEKGVFLLIFSELARSTDREPEASAGPEASVEPEDALMVDATYVKARRTASSLKKGRCPRLIGRTKGASPASSTWSATAKGALSVFYLSEGQCSDFSGADVLLRDLPEAEQGITPSIPSRRNRNQRLPYSKKLYKMRHKVENLFAKLKDWRRIATRYDRCAYIFLSAVLLAATVLSWL